MGDKAAMAAMAAIMKGDKACRHGGRAAKADMTRRRRQQSSSETRLGTKAAGAAKAGRWRQR